jgi:hypothetical protein
MASAPIDRLQAAVAAFVRELFPNLDYQGFYEYSVYDFDEGAQTATLQNTSASSKMPQALSKVPLRLQGAGTVTLAAGSTVLVGFENGSPTAPFIAFYGKTGDAPEKKLYLNVTTELKLGQDATAGVARGGDQTTTLLPPFVFTGTLNGQPLTGVMVASTGQTLGVISTYSDKVKSA